MYSIALLLKGLLMADLPRFERSRSCWSKSSKILGAGAAFFRASFLVSCLGFSDCMMVMMGYCFMNAA